MVVPASTDAESLPPLTTGASAEQSSERAGKQVKTHFGFDPQLGAGPQPKSMSISVGEQTNFQSGPWRLESNGSGLMNAMIAPVPRHLLGRFNDYLGRLSYDQKTWGSALRFGLVAPSLYSDAEFTTAAIPREGLESVLRTPVGTGGFFVNTSDVSPGGGNITAFHQLIRGASYDLPLPPGIASLRFMWLSSRDVGSPVAEFVSNSGSLTAVPMPLATPTAGNNYGGLLQVHFTSNWLWTSEYAWSRTSLNATDPVSRRLGRAWRSGVTGHWRKTEIHLSYRDVGRDFGTPANPALTPLSNPDRQGLDVSVKQASKFGNLLVGYQYLRSGVNQPDRPIASLHSLIESWQKNVRRNTIVTVQAHEAKSTTGTLPADLQALNPLQQLSLNGNQRDVGGKCTISQQLGSLVLNATGSRDWMSDRIVPQQSSITSGLQLGANWRARSFFQFQSGSSASWIVRDRQSLGSLRILSVYMQPMLIWRRTGLSVAPVFGLSQNQGILANGVSTQNLVTSQAGGRLTWQLPAPFRFAAFSIEGIQSEVRNGMLPPALRNVGDSRLIFLVPVIRDF